MSAASLEHEQLAFPLPLPARAPRPRQPPAAAPKPAHVEKPLEFAQPVLRPVAFFVDLVLVTPARARDICIPPAARAPKDFRFRRQREGRKPVSIGHGKLRGKERRELAVWDYQAPILGIKRYAPLTVLDCRPGPCPRVACQFNLYLDVDPATGFIKLNFPDKDIDELEETCADRIARRAAEMRRQPRTETVAKLLNLTDERLRQIEKGAIAKLGPAVEGFRTIL
jgi:hypothetical protein